MYASPIDTSSFYLLVRVESILLLVQVFNWQLPHHRTWMLIPTKKILRVTVVPIKSKQLIVDEGLMIKIRSNGTLNRRSTQYNEVGAK